MRCKCCDNEQTKFILDDWYCAKCAEAILNTIKEDRSIEIVDKRYYYVNKEKL